MNALSGSKRRNSYNQPSRPSISISSDGSVCLSQFEDKDQTGISTPWIPPLPPRSRRFSLPYNVVHSVLRPGYYTSVSSQGKCMLLKSKSQDSGIYFYIKVEFYLKVMSQHP